jgi:hypothetical protein
MHFMAKPGTHLGKLHEAGYSIRNDLLRGAEVGFIAGGVFGLVVGIVLYATQPVGIALQPVIVLAMALLFGLLGAWSSSMIGIALPNSQLSQFEEEIGQGKILLIVDVPRNRVDEIRGHWPHTSGSKCAGLRARFPGVSITTTTDTG